jgi:DNA-binding CsgD family transcriptional regulator
LPDFSAPKNLQTIPFKLSVPGDDRTRPEASAALEIAKAVADEARDGVILCDEHGNPLHMNSHASALLAVSHAAEVHRMSVSAMSAGELQQAQVNGFFVTARPLLVDGLRSIGIVIIRLNPAVPDEQSLRARFGLSRREAEVAVLLAERRTDAEIAAALGISWHTVRSHVERIFLALRCHTRREAAVRLNAPAQTNTLQQRTQR